MFDTPPGPTPETIGFVLVPGYSMMAFLSAIEPLRVANRLSGRANARPMTGSAKQSILHIGKNGSLRSFAPRKDDVT